MRVVPTWETIGGVRFANGRRHPEPLWATRTKSKQLHEEHARATSHNRVMFARSKTNETDREMKHGWWGSNRLLPGDNESTSSSPPSLKKCSKNSNCTYVIQLQRRQTMICTMRRTAVAQAGGGTTQAGAGERSDRAHPLLYFFLRMSSHIASPSNCPASGSSAGFAARSQTMMQQQQQHACRLRRRKFQPVGEYW